MFWSLSLAVASFLERNPEGEGVANLISDYGVDDQTFLVLVRNFTGGMSALSVLRSILWMLSINGALT